MNTLDFQMDNYTVLDLDAIIVESFVTTLDERDDVPFVTARNSPSCAGFSDIDCSDCKADVW